MKSLKNVECIVEKILVANEDSRKNDDILYLYVCEHCCKGISSISLKNFLSIRKNTNCPSFATVMRTRRKIFEKRPELKPKRVTELRESMIDVFVDYALNG